MSGDLAPPPSPPAPGPGPTRGPLRWGAILVGAGVDVALTRVSSTVLAMAVGMLTAWMHPTGTTDAAAPQSALHSMHASLWFFVLSLGAGLLCSVAGGFLTGYLAKTGFLLNAAIMGVCSGSYGLLSHGMSALLVITPSRLELTAATVPAAMLGGWLASLGHGRRAGGGV